MKHTKRELIKKVNLLSGYIDRQHLLTAGFKTQQIEKLISDGLAFEKEDKLFIAEAAFQQSVTFRK